jgi:EmrB/QacA subfamily drug resistance transporter
VKPQTMTTTPDGRAGTGQPAAGQSRRRWLVLAVLAAVAFMAQLDLYIVNVAVPAMGHSFPGATLSSLSWVLNAYAIVFAALLVPAGRLTDHYGRRRALLLGVVVFTGASVVCALGPTLPIVVAGRLLQGVGAAMILPPSLGLLWPAFPKREHNLVVGIWAGVAAVAGSSGPVLGGLLVSIDWRWIFLINLPIGVAIVIGGRIVLPEARAEQGARLPSATSVAAVLAAVALIVLATVQGARWGWGNAGVYALLAGGLLAAGLTVWQAVHSPRAIAEASLFRSRQFATASIALFLFFLAFGTWLLLTVLFFENVWHYSALETGLAIVPGPLTSAVLAINTGRITALLGRSASAAIGSLAFAGAGVFWLLTVSSHPGYVATFLPGLILCGIGAGMTQAPLFAAASTLAADRATTGSAVLNMMRQVGSALGVAVLVALMAGRHVNPIGGYDRGWVFLSATAVAAALTILAGARGRAASPSSALSSSVPGTHSRSSDREGPS